MPSPIHHLVKQKQKLAIAPCTCCGAQLSVCDASTVGYTDTSGNLWCLEHKTRGLIMDYGKACQWPNVNIGTYAIGAGYDMWKLIIALCDTAMIDALAAAIGLERAGEASA